MIRKYNIGDIVYAHCIDENIIKCRIEEQISSEVVEVRILTGTLRGGYDRIPYRFLFKTKVGAILELLRRAQRARREWVRWPYADENKFTALLSFKKQIHKLKAMYKNAKSKNN